MLYNRIINNAILNNLKGDILTLRRQIQLGENEFKKRSLTIFILKSIFVLLLLSIIVGVLVRTKMISKNIALTVVAILVTANVSKSRQLESHAPEKLPSSRFVTTQV